MPPMLSELLAARLRELRLSKHELAKRLGYANIAKGCRRIDELLAGGFPSERMIANLADALHLPATELARAAEATKALEAHRVELAAREAFRPHAIILTERSVPSQITICGLAGGPARFKRIELDARLGRETFIWQAMAELRRRQQEWRIEDVPFFGRPMGIVVNYAYERGMRFDLAGEPLGIVSPAAAKLGYCEIPLLGPTKA